MNGFEQIKSFYSWVFNNQDKIRPTHISLYMFLVNQNNRSMWVEWFKCPYDLAMQGACIGNKNTYYKCLDDLKSWNLIDYQKGVNNHKAPLIKLFCLYDSEPLTGNVTVPLSAPLTVPQPEPLSVLLSGNIYKLITSNYKLINQHLESWYKNHQSNPKFDYKKSLLELVDDQQLVEDFMQLKKLKKASLSKTAFDTLVNECTVNRFDLKEALRLSIEKNWQGFRVEWAHNLQKGNSHQSPPAIPDHRKRNQL